MNFLLRGSSRQSAFRSFSHVGPAAATLLGIKVGRGVILRISGLLALRSVLFALSLPIDTGVLSYVWSFLFASVQASVAVAAAANFLDWGGLLGAVGDRLFASKGDAAFVTLYGSMVLVLGPMLGMVESAILVYEIMRLSREATDRMFEAEGRGEGRLIRNTVFAVVAVCSAVSAYVVYATHQVYPGLAPRFMAGVIVALYAQVPLTEDGHLLEAAVLALVCCLTLAVGLVEELDVPTGMLDGVLASGMGGKSPSVLVVGGRTLALQGGEVRAVVLVYTTVVLLGTMSRAPRFARLLQRGADRVREEEAAEKAVCEHRGDVGGEDGSARNETGALEGIWGGLLNALVVIGVTFRTLVWSGEVRVGEYCPGVVRAVQVVTMVLLQRCYLTWGKEQAVPEPEPEPERDIAGNIIPNPR